MIFISEKDPQANAMKRIPINLQWFKEQTLKN